MFEFFRKYQKLILYTAGIFALVSFSITGALLGFFDSVFSGRVAREATIVVDGRRVSLTEQDFLIGGRLAQGHYGAAPVLVLPRTSRDENVGEALAILRRAAIETGFDLSQTEVDRALEPMITSGRYPSIEAMAQQVRSPSVSDYRQMVAEAWRIGLLMRLSALGTDTSDAALLAQSFKDRENVNLDVATYDVEAVEESIEAAGVSDDDLNTFLDDLTETDKNALQIFAPNESSLRIAAVMFDAFDSATFTEELKDVEFTEAQLKAAYERDKRMLFVVPKDDGEGNGEDPDENPQDAAAALEEYVPFEDEAVQATVKKRLEAEAAFQSIWDTVREERQTRLEVPTKAARDAAQARGTATMDVAKQKQEFEDAGGEGVADPILQAAVTQKENDLELAEAAEKAAEEALDQARLATAWQDKFRELVAGRAGMKLLDVPGPKPADEFEELPELGTWQNFFVSTSQGREGAIYSTLSRTKLGAFYFQVHDLKLRPLKPMDDIRDALTERYLKDKADERAKEAQETLEEQLLELAKAKIPEEVQKLEAEKVTEVESRMITWEEQTTADLASATTEFGQQRAGSKAQQAWADRRDKLQTDLDTLAVKRTEVTKSVEDEFEQKIKDAAREKYSEVLVEAAQAAGFTISTFESLPRNSNSEPRFAEKYGDAAAFVVRSLGQLKEGESTEILNDFTNRQRHIAVVRAVTSADADVLNRREVANARNSAPAFLSQAIMQSFSLDAVKARYGYEELAKPGDAPVNESAAGAGAGTTGEGEGN